MYGAECVKCKSKKRPSASGDSDVGLRGRREVNVIDYIKKQNFLAAAYGLFRLIAIILFFGLILAACVYLTAPSD
jgi:hypothetical protein